MYNLTEKLLPADKEALEALITSAISVKPIDIDYILRYWNKSKQKLFKLLDNQFTYEIPYSLNPEEYKEERNRRCWSDKVFYNLVHEFAHLFSRYVYHLGDNFNVIFLSVEKENELYHKIREEHKVCYMGSLGRALMHHFATETVAETEKWEIILGDDIGAPENKRFRIDEGTKATRVLQVFAKAVKPYVDESFYNTLITLKDKIAVEYSRILNNLKAGGTLCISILPIDYLTMSVNSFDWTSCLNFYKGGHRAGAAELMNSNCIVCAYMKSNSNDYQIDEIHSCSNKKWRQLFVVTKDILCCGKPYPYENDNFTLTILEKLRYLVEKNWHVTYKYGMQTYADTVSTFSASRIPAFQFTPKAKRIVFSTKSMYNDWDQSYDRFYCYRNPIKHSYILSLSGKNVCLCCGKEDYLPLYNDLDWRNRAMECRVHTCTDCNNNIIHKW